MKRRNFFQVIAGIFGLDTAKAAPVSKLNRPSEVLPPMNKYVLGHYCGGNWLDSRDQIGCEWHVMRLEPDTPQPNNPFPYRWGTFGPSSHFFLNVDYWCELPQDCRSIEAESQASRTKVEEQDRRAFKKLNEIYLKKLAVLMAKKNPL